MGALWVAKGPMFLQAENYDSDQTVQMCRLNRIVAVRTCQLVPYVGYRLIHQGLMTIRGRVLPCKAEIKP